MFINELFENDGRQILVIYPGRFQPFHSGHAAVYSHLCEKYGANNVYIITSNKVDPPRSPFSFDDKKMMMELTGVDTKHIVFDAQPYQAKDFVAKFDASNTILLFAVSEKDMAEDPRFQFKPKKDGSPSYFQPLTSLANAEPLSTHAYITTVPTFNFTVLGKPANSATQIRAQFASADEATQKKIVTDLFGKFDPTVYAIMKQKLSGGAVTEGIFDRFKKKKEPQRLPVTAAQRNFIKKYLPGSNADIKWANLEYVLPDNVNGSYGRGRFSFRNLDGQLIASVEHYRSKEDMLNRKQMPITHTEHIISGPEDMEKIKNMISERKGEVAEGHDLPDGEDIRKKHFEKLPKEIQDAMKPRLDKGRGYWDSYYKAKKQSKKEIKEDSESDNQIFKIQVKYKVTRKEAAEMYYVDRVRVLDNANNSKKKKHLKKIDEEIIHTIQFKNFIIKVDDHYLQRSHQRKVGHAESGRVIEKFSKVDDQLQEVLPGQQFWVFDQKQNVALGMRKLSNINKTMQILLKTVIRGEPPEQGRTPIITIL